MAALRRSWFGEKITVRGKINTTQMAQLARVFKNDLWLHASTDFAPCKLEEFKRNFPHINETCGKS
jgi:hypothetical protein